MNDVPAAGTPDRRDAWALAEVEPSFSLPGRTGAPSVGYAAGMGALRGIAAACAYAVLLVALGGIAGLVGFDGSLHELGSGAAFALLVLMYVLLFATPVGAVLGTVFGMALLPFARRPSTFMRPRVAGLVTGILAAAGMALVFVPGAANSAPWSDVWLALLALAVLPGVVGGVAAGRHMKDLLRR